MVELALEVPLPRFLTSQVIVSLCLRMCQNTHKNSRETAARLRRLTVNLSWLLPSSRSKVSISDKQPPDLLVNVTATSDALQSTCLTFCLSDFTEAAKTPPTIFHPLLSNYFLLSACLLLSGYFLAVSCYKSMHLTTNAYGILSLLCS